MNGVLEVKNYKVKDLKVKVGNYMKKSHDNGRYLSFDHCFRYFNENYQTQDDKIKNMMTLYFYAYMASWGMLRNSFLLYKDYLFNKPIIELLCKKREALQKDIKDLKGTSNLILTVKKDIVNMYKYKNGEEKKNNENKYYKEETELKVNPKEPDTLVSKAILGTLGIVPAYDRFFKFSAKQFNIKQSLNEKSLSQLNEFYIDNKKDIDYLCKKYNYPPMKIVDMYFWQKAYECSTLSRIIEITNKKGYTEKQKIENINNLIKGKEEKCLLGLKLSNDLNKIKTDCENLINAHYQNAIEK